MLGFTGEDSVNFFPPAPEALQSTQTDRQFFGRGEAVWSVFDGRFKNFFGVNYTDEWSHNVDPNPDSFTPPPAVTPPSTNLGQRTQVDWRGEARVISGQTFVFGLEDKTESLSTDSTGAYNTAGIFTPFTTNASTGDKAGWFELQSEFMHRLFIVSNIRYDDNESFGPHTTWRVAPAFIVPWTDTKLKATYGTGFKAPTLTELYVNFPSFLTVANPNLAPETSTGYDIGFEQPLLHDRVAFRCDLLPQRHHKPHRRNVRSGHLHLVLRERRAGHDPRRRGVCLRSCQQQADASRRLHLYRGTRRHDRPGVVAATREQSESFGHLVADRQNDSNHDVFVREPMGGC